MHAIIFILLSLCSILNAEKEANVIKTEQLMEELRKIYEDTLWRKPLENVESLPDYNVASIAFRKMHNEVVPPEDYILLAQTKSYLRKYTHESLIKTAEFFKTNMGYTGDLAEIKYFRNFLLTDTGKNMILQFRKALGDLISKDQLQNNAVDVLKKIWELIQTDIFKKLISDLRAKNEEIERAKEQAEKDRIAEEEAKKKAIEDAEKKKAEDLANRTLKTSYDLTDFTCPTGYTKYDNKYCFRVFPNRVTTFETERKLCYDYGGYLVDRNRKYATLKISIKQSVYTSYMYTGMNDLNWEQGNQLMNWQASDGSYEAIPLSNWYARPDNWGGNENCLLTNRNGQTGDVPCTFRTRVHTVCETNPIRSKPNNDISKWKQTGEDPMKLGWISKFYSDNRWITTAKDIATPKDCLTACTSKGRYCISFYFSNYEKMCHYNHMFDARIPKVYPSINDYEKWMPEPVYLHNKNDEH